MTALEQSALLGSLVDVVAELVMCAAAEEPISQEWAHTVLTTLVGQARDAGLDPDIDLEEIAEWSG